MRPALLGKHDHLLFIKPVPDLHRRLRCHLFPKLTRNGSRVTPCKTSQPRAGPVGRPALTSTPFLPVALSIATSSQAQVVARCDVCFISTAEDATPNSRRRPTAPRFRKGTWSRCSDPSYIRISMRPLGHCFGSGLAFYKNLTSSTTGLYYHFQKEISYDHSKSMREAIG